MQKNVPYQIPIEIHRTEIEVVNSHFITTIARADSVTKAKEFLNIVRGEMPDASHHVYAFRIGYGNSVTEGMSDDGEPPGTAGPPTLAVLRGSDIGDIILIITRYFGGTKLGTGGLVRAYSEAARTGLQTLKTEWKIEKTLLGIDTPYNLYDQVKRLIEQYNGIIQEEIFAEDVTVLAIFPLNEVSVFSTAISDLSAGRLIPVDLGSNE